MDRTVAEALVTAFGKMYVDSDVIGILPSDQINPVMLNGVALSDEAPDHARKAGCPDGTLAIIAGFADPSECGMAPDQVPPANAWICFPDEFYGLPVFYFPCEISIAFPDDEQEPRS